MSDLEINTSDDLVRYLRFLFTVASWSRSVTCRLLILEQTICNLVDSDDLSEHEPLMAAVSKEAIDWDAKMWMTYFKWVGTEPEVSLIDLDKAVQIFTKKLYACEDLISKMSSKYHVEISPNNYFPKGFPERQQ